MNQSGEAAESVVRMSLDGMKLTLNTVGIAGKNVIVLLYAILKDNKKIRGKTTLKKMIKSERSLKVFTLKKEDLKKFKEVSKLYGVLFCAISEKKNKTLDGMVDIIVRAEDAPKINRIVDKFKLATLEAKATIKSNVEVEKKDRKNSKEDQLAEEVISNTARNNNQNPNMMTTENPQSDRSSKSKDFSEGSSKTSVRKKLKDIKIELDRKIKTGQSKDKNKIKNKFKRGGR